MFMAIFYAVTMVISLYMSHQASKTKDQSKKPNLDIEDGNFPVATEDKNYQLIYGTVLMESPNCTWVGDLNAFPIKEKVKQKGLFGSKSKNVTVSWGYRAGFKIALGYGGVNLRELRFEDKPFYSTSANGNTDINISFHKSSGSSSVVDTSSSYRNFFGDYTKEGGIEGNIYFHSGIKTQDYIPSYLTSKVGKDYIYSNKGQSYLLFKDFYYGNAKQLKMMSAVLNRIPSIRFLNNTYSEIDGIDCNPVNIISDLLTSFENGAGVNENELDIETYISTQKKLYDEGFGLSLNISSDAIIRDTLLDVMERVDAVNFINNATGRFGLKLIRKPKNDADLMVIDDSVVLKGGYKSITKNAPNMLINQLKLTYTDSRDNFKKKVISFSNESNYMETREVISKSISMDSVTNLELAKKLLIREIKPLTKDHFKCELMVNRSCRFLQPGDMVILNSSKYKINNLRMRVLSVNIGNTVKSNITLDLVEDLYGEMDYGLAVNVDKPQDVQGELELFDYSIIDAPYLISSLDDNVLNDDIQDQIIIAEKPNVETVAYFINDKDGYIVDEYVDFTKSLKVKAITSRTSNTIEFDGYFTPDDITDSTLALIIKSDNRQEIINFKNVDYINNILKEVDRGCVDTLPLKLDIGDSIYLLGSGFWTLVDADHKIGSYASYKLLPTGVNKTMDSSLVPIANHLIVNRASLPLPVARVSVNGSVIVQDDIITTASNMILNFTYKEKSKVNITPYYKLGLAESTDGINTEITIKRSNGTTLSQELITNGNYEYDFLTETGTFTVTIVNIDIKGRRSISNPSFKIIKT